MSGFIAALQSAIILQSLFFIGVLCLQQQRDWNQRLHLGLLALLSVHMVLNLQNSFHWLPDFPVLTFGFGLWYGPIIYLYIQSLVFSDFRWQAHNWLHFLPGLVLSLLVFSGSPMLWWSAGLTLLSMLVYAILAARVYRRFTRILCQTQSAEDQIAMRWAWQVLQLNMAALLLNVLNILLLVFTGQSALKMLAEISVFVFLWLLVNILGIHGRSQHQLFAGVTAEDEAIAEQSGKAAPAELGEERQQLIEQKLLAHMNTRQPYLDPMFNLQMLGRQLGETPRYVSVVINQRLGQSFADFVNSYRLQQVKACLADPLEQRTILEIIYSCGFSTKSNFNRAFKQQEGTTPSAFRARLKTNN
ncbi:MAG: helix-turn-helix domain-containing protein [Rheinheimera sp.]|nr:helix-turn-helix domain-containing protein [Rheinheimera sp.]